MARPETGSDREWVSVQGLEPSSPRASGFRQRFVGYVAALAAPGPAHRLRFPTPRRRTGSHRQSAGSRHPPAGENRRPRSGPGAEDSARAGRKPRQGADPVFPAALPGGRVAVQPGKAGRRRGLFSAGAGSTGGTGGGPRSEPGTGTGLLFPAGPDRRSEAGRPGQRPGGGQPRRAAGSPQRLYHSGGSEVEAPGQRGPADVSIRHPRGPQ